MLKLVSLSQRNVIAIGIPGIEDDASWQDWDVDEPDIGNTHVETRERNTQDVYSVRSLSLLTGISKSEVSNALTRCYESGLAKYSQSEERPTVNVRALGEFLIHGIRYVFPTKMQGMTRGIATSLTAPIFNGLLKTAAEQNPVWPDAKGNTSGFAVVPLFKTVPQAVREDQVLYVLLALIDSIRLGLPRERTLAVSVLEKLLHR